MPLIAGIAPDGGLIHIVDPPKTGVASGVKVGPAETTVDPRGLVVARFAQLNVIDSDGDVSVTGAVGSGQDVVISGWQHGSWEKGAAMLPVGKGRVTEEGSWLLLRGHFFMDTFAGRETFLTLKGLGERCEWSFGFTIAEGGAERGLFSGRHVRFLRKLLITECSPVLRGSGIGTATVELSSMDPRSIELANASRDNDRALLALRGFVPPSRQIVGYVDGKPVRVTSGGRKG